MFLSYSPQRLFINLLLLLQTQHPSLGLIFWTTHIRLFCLWRDMSSSSFVISLSFSILFLHLRFRRSLEFTHKGFHSVIFSPPPPPIQLSSSQHFILCALTYLTLYSLLINFSNSSFPILYPSSVLTAPSVLLHTCLSNTSKLFTSLIANVQLPQPWLTIGLISVTYDSFLACLLIRQNAIKILRGL